MSETSSSKEGLPAECPVCYEKFHPLEAMRRQLNCGHIFCHDCLVKCLPSAKLDGQVQSSIICPICRYVTFLSKKKALWPPKARTNSWTLEMPLSPSSLSHLTKMEANNTLVVPSHFVMPVQSFDWRFSTGSSPMDSRGVPGKLAREVHIFVITAKARTVFMREQAMSTFPGQQHLAYAHGQERQKKSLQNSSLSKDILLLDEAQGKAS
ncbi:hypothetical protein Q9233_010517 [Columba guinea]|nr:hypothetical protein Q9233_017778 [Columba guinea]KAK2510566.1 hypothetical protein Q9233_017601 [Columba guinea]KAK2510568.1 hypothetical protein Q9233_017603 [Columba guinea]KAK2510574.1 hypothetical protein Q9233_017609 [Columba guinea]KAK2510576.1 hypothetical protein Q9233_017611 [Columba guinea]